VAALVSFTAFAFAGDDLVGITIDVAPNVLNLQRPGDSVTVHTDIFYDDVVPSSVKLKIGENEDIPIDSWKFDLRGYFVAKFRMLDVINLSLEPGKYYAFTLTGSNSEGYEFSGTQEILVLDNVPINDPKCPR